MTIDEAYDYLRRHGFTFDQIGTDEDDHGNEHWRRENDPRFYCVDSVLIKKIDDGFVFQACVHGINSDLAKLFSE